MRGNPKAFLAVQYGLLAAAGLLGATIPEASEVIWEAECSACQSEPGHAIRVSAHMQNGSRSAVFQAVGWGQTVELQPLEEEPGMQEGFLAIPLGTQVGPVGLTIQAFSNDGELIGRKHFPFFVLGKEFKPKHQVRVKGFNSRLLAREGAELAEARSNAHNQRGCRISSFLMPVSDGTITGPFGEGRVYNGGAGSWNHKGIDIAAPLGTPVSAPAAGVVVLSRQYQGSGIVTLIAHGFGVTTTYLHQQSQKATAGETVCRGQVIGEIGTSGISQGPHLHFQVNVNGIPVEPGDFFEAACYRAGK